MPTAEKLKISITEIGPLMSAKTNSEKFVSSIE